MSAAIKPGDLVMVVRPNTCCGSTSSIGEVGIVVSNPSWGIYAECDCCGATSWNTENFRTIGDGAYHVDTLQKIDPPAVGDSLPTRCEIEVAA